jgi:hypothetical protein
MAGFESILLIALGLDAGSHQCGVAKRSSKGGAKCLGVCSTCIWRMQPCLGGGLSTRPEQPPWPKLQQQLWPKGFIVLWIVKCCGLYQDQQQL